MRVLTHYMTPHISTNTRAEILSLWALMYLAMQLQIVGSESKSIERGMSCYNLAQIHVFVK